jgi:hypothetical protein
MKKIRSKMMWALTMTIWISRTTPPRVKIRITKSMIKVTALQNTWTTGHTKGTGTMLEWKRTRSHRSPQAIPIKRRWKPPTSTNGDLHRSNTINHPIVLPHIPNTPLPRIHSFILLALALHHHRLNHRLRVRINGKRTRVPLWQDIPRHLRSNNAVHGTLTPIVGEPLHEVRYIDEYGPGDRERSFEVTSMLRINLQPANIVLK